MRYVPTPQLPPPLEPQQPHVSYRAAGLPDLELILDEVATFKDGLIVHLEDTYEDEMKRAMDAYVEEHRDALGLARA